jgi:hypothetical protein
LYSKCKQYFYIAINRRRLSAISDIFFFSKYLKNEPKTMSKHIDKLLMIPLFNTITSSEFLVDYRSQMALQSFDFNRTYKSKSIFCGTTLTYTVLHNPEATYEQLCSSYMFKLRFFPDNDSGLQEDTVNILKISGTAIKGCYDMEAIETDKLPPKAIYLDKNTLMNLLLHKFDYDHDSMATIKKEKSKNIFKADNMYNIDEEMQKEKSNYVLLRIDKLLDGLNLKSRQYNMSHFQISNMTEYRDFFHRLIVLGKRKELYHSKRKHGDSFTVLLDPLAPSSNNRFFRDAAASSKRETGSEKRITVNKQQQKLPRDYFKITINDPNENPMQLPSNNDSQSSNAVTVLQRDWSRGRTKADHKKGDEVHRNVDHKHTHLQNAQKRHLPKLKRLEDDDQIDKLSSIPHKDKVDIASPSNRSAMSSYEGEEEITSTELKKAHSNLIVMEKNSRGFTRSQTNNIEASDDKEDRRHQYKSSTHTNNRLVERYIRFM